MSATCSDARHLRTQQAGFTLNELVIVMVIGAILAAFAIPKFNAALSLRDDAWRDSLVSALRIAQKTAVSHRRLVCATVSNTSVTLNVASANPATACDSALLGPNGTATFATASDSQTTTGVSPAGVIFFQPDGRVTSDGAGVTSSSRTITPSGTIAIGIVGETGHVE